MSYKVQFDLVGAKGTAIGRPTVQIAASKAEAIEALSTAIQLWRQEGRMMMFRVFGPKDELLLSYTSA